MFLLFEGFQLQNAFTLLLLSKKHSYLLTAKITPYFLTLVIVGIMGLAIWNILMLIPLQIVYVKKPCVEKVKDTDIMSGRHIVIESDNS